MDPAVIHTVGHSTRSLEELADVLSPVGVQLVVDVRSVPGSRRNPQFRGEALARSLPPLGIDYRHEARLGGFRRPRPGSPNGGWEHPAFRGYADHMATAEFGSALEQLQADARARSTSIMCAEAQWWRCHRRLIADALVIRDWTVLHVGLGAEPIVHQLTEFAVRGSGGELTYPPPQGELKLA